MDSSKIGRLGNADTKDVAAPDRKTGTAGLNTGGEKFEPADWASVRGGPKAGVSLHGGHSNTSGSASPKAQAGLRGHHEMNFAAVTGHGVAKRSTGKKTPATTIDRGMD